MFTNASAPAMAVDRGAESHTQTQHHRIAINSPVERLLAHLHKVRKSGRGWTAKCPAHEDRMASLSIAAGDDGRVLLHCFAGCAAADVLASIGLELADLFVKRPTANMTFVERAVLRERAQRANMVAAAAVLEVEASVLLAASHDLAQLKPLSYEDHDRVITAMFRVGDARRVLRAR